MKLRPPLPQVGDAACASAAGGALGDAAAEAFFAAEALPWACRHADELAEPVAVSRALDYLAEMRRIKGPSYVVAARTPASLARSIEEYELTTITFDDDEIFEPNPRGLKGLLRAGAGAGGARGAARAPAGTKVRVPYDGTYVAGRSGEFEKAGGGGPQAASAIARLFWGDVDSGFEDDETVAEGGAESAAAAGVSENDDDDDDEAEQTTVRIAEILSLRRLIYEGEQLGNCLRDKPRSQIKYVSRARQRASSFWSLTRSRPRADGAPRVEHLCLIEVWHLRQGNIIRQAEGVRPRTIPSAEAWYWLEQWCDAEGVDLSTWDCYS